MATSSASVFNTYVKDGSKLSSMKDFFQFFESLYNGINDKYKAITSFINDPFGALGLNDMLANLKSSQYVSNWLSDLGFTDESLGLINKYSGGLLSSLDGALGDLMETAMAGAKSYFDSALSEVISKIYVPEDVFLVTVKGLYKIGADQNYGNTLLTLCLEHDLPKTLEWLDDVNDSTYSIQDANLNSRAIQAAENGSFNVAKYIMKEMGKAYNEAKNQPAFTEKEVKSLKEIKIKYEEWFVEVFKSVFVHSYGNFTVTEMDRFFRLGGGCPEIKPSNIGTSDKDFFAKFALTAADVDEIAPIVTVNYDYGWGSIPKQYIMPRNREIKKLYVYAVNGFSNSPLESKLLHDRLTLPLYDINIAALNKMSDTFAGSGVGRWLKNARNERDKAIHTLCGKVEDLLFDPSKQALLAYYDKTTIPDFISSSAEYKQSSSQDINAPVPSIMSDVGATYESFEVFELPDGVTHEEIRDKVLAIKEYKPNISHSVTKNIAHVTIDSSGEISTDTKTFYIFYDDSITTLNKEVLDEIILYVLSKYIIDKYLKLEGNYTIEELIAMFPDLSEQFIYLKSYSQNILSNKTVEEKEVPISQTVFYESVIDSDGNTYSVGDVGVVKVTPDGKVTTFATFNYPVAGLTIDANGNIIIAVYDGETTIVYAPNPLGEYIIVDAFDSAPNVIVGCGIGSVTNLIFYGAIYFGNKYYIIDGGSTPNKIIVSDDIENKTVLAEIDILGALSLPSSTVINGLSIMPDGYFYAIFDNLYVYKFKIDSSFQVYSIVKLDVSKDDISSLLIKYDRIGSIATSVTINYGTVYDINIDDPTTIRSIVSFYKRSRPLMWILKYNDVDELVITRTESVYEESKTFGEYINPDDPSYRETNDYHGMVDNSVSTSGYTPSKVFEKYLSESSGN